MSRARDHRLRRRGGGGRSSTCRGLGSTPPGYTTNRTGDVHDFDYFAGGWTTQQRRLKARGVGSTEWEESTATLCMSLYLGGIRRPARRGGRSAVRRRDGG